MRTPVIEIYKASDSKNIWPALPVINRKMVLSREGKKFRPVIVRE